MQLQAAGAGLQNVGALAAGIPPGLFAGGPPGGGVPGGIPGLPPSLLAAGLPPTSVAALAAAAAQYGDVTGWIYTIMAIAIAAAEVAIGLAIFLSLYGHEETISLDEMRLLKH